MLDQESDRKSSYAIPMYQKVGIGAGLVLPAMAMAMWYTYAVIFFEKVLGLSAKSTGTIVLVAQTAGAISGPLVGVWSDQSNCKCGRRKMTHLACAVAMALPFFFIWHTCIACDHTPSMYQTVYFISFAALSICGITGCQIALYSLIPELASERAVIVELNSIW